MSYRDFCLADTEYHRIFVPREDAMAYIASTCPVATGTY